MAGRVFGSAIAGLVAIGAAHAGKKIVIPDSADMFAELYALEELCPTMKIDANAVAQFASRSLIDADTLQWILAEGRRRSPIKLEKAEVHRGGSLRVRAQALRQIPDQSVSPARSTPPAANNLRTFLLGRQVVGHRRCCGCKGGRQ